MSKTVKVAKKTKLSKKIKYKRKYKRKYNISRGGSLFGSSKYPTVDDIVNRFLKDYNMHTYAYYGSLKRTFKLGTSKTAEYQLGKLIDIIRNIAKLVLHAAKQSEKYQKSSNIKEYVLRFIKYRFSNPTILECSIKCDRQPSYYSREQNCPENCEAREIIETSGTSQTVSKVCYKIQDSVIDNNNYNSRLIEIIKKMKEIDPTRMKFFNGKTKSLDAGRDYDYRLRVIETIQEYYQLIKDNFNLFNREVISFIANNSVNISTNMNILQSKTNTTTYYPCKK